jgi:hypothetical protein
MNSPMMHWAPGSWRDNLDELAADPERAQAVPADPPMDLMGRIRVRLCAEDGGLVAYGFGQRIVLPAASVGAVRTVDAYRARRADRVRSRGRGLLIFDHEDRILVRASGLWETQGEVATVCRAAGVPAPSHVEFPVGRSAELRYGVSSTRQLRKIRKMEEQQTPPLYQEAPGYCKLRDRPRGTVARVLALMVLFLLTIGFAALAGTRPAIALPEWIGAVRVLLGIAGAVLGLFGGGWLFVAVTHVIKDGLRWAVASRSARTLAPPDRFFHRRERSDAWSGLATAGMVVLVPALIGWGPGVGIASLVHGLSDSRTVAELRAHGVSTPGFLIDVPDYSTDDKGDTTVTDVATLAFIPDKQDGPWETTDPAIGGRPLPLNQADLADTRYRVTVVYLPGDPDTAAAKQQIVGSVWRGAPTANMIVASVFTLALPLLIVCLVFRLRRRRFLRDAVLLGDFAPGTS